MQVDPPVKLLLAVGNHVRGEPAAVEVRLTAGEPGHVGVPGAVDGPVDHLAGGHVHHPQQRLLVTTLGQLVGQQPAVLVGLPVIERGGAGRVEHRRVDQDPFALSGSGRVEDGMLLASGSPHEEPPFASPGRGADVASAQQLGDPRGQGLPVRALRQLPGQQGVLRGQPGPGLFGVGVLKPAIRIGDQPAMDPFRNFFAAGGGISGCGHGPHSNSGRLTNLWLHAGICRCLAR